MTKNGKRAYVSDDVFERMKKFSAANGHKHQQDAYDAVIQSALDENGVPRTVLAMSEAQRKIIDSISGELGQSPEKTAQDLINFAMLVYGTNVTLRELVVFSAPLFMDNLIDSHPEIAKDILKGLTQKKIFVKNQQAALRYPD